MEEKTKGLPRRKYDAAFKADILKMVAKSRCRRNNKQILLKE